MKNLFKFSLVLGVALLTMNANASGPDFSLGVKKEQSRIITFVLNDAKKLDLSIYDSTNSLIHSESVTSSKAINKSYDLKDLPEGIYYLQAESDSKISRYKISIVGKSAIVSNTAISEIYKPVFEEKDGLVTVNIQNDAKSKAYIRVYDRDDNEVYDSGVMKDSKISKNFNVSNVVSEGYTFVVNYDNKSFTKAFAAR